MEIKEKAATQYPVRYDAFNENKVLFIRQENSHHTAGSELAVYYDKMPNPNYEGIDDGLYCECIWHAQGYYLISLQVTLPVINRSQFVREEIRHNPQDAKQCVLELIKEGYRFINDSKFQFLENI